MIGGRGQVRSRIALRKPLGKRPAIGYPPPLETDQRAITPATLDAERWQRGRMRRTRNAVYGKP